MCSCPKGGGAADGDAASVEPDGLVAAAVEFACDKDASTSVRTSSWLAVSSRTAATSAGCTTSVVGGKEETGADYVNRCKGTIV